MYRKFLRAGIVKLIDCLSWFIDFETHKKRQNRLNKSYQIRKDWEIKTDEFSKLRVKFLDDIGTKNNMDKVMSAIIQANLDKRSKNMPKDKIDFFHRQYKSE